MLTDDVRRWIDSRGEQGRAWVAALPAIVERLCDMWSLTIGPVLEGGKGALVLRVTRDGVDDITADWARLDRPCSVEFRDTALMYAHRRRDAAAATVLCHGDPHPANALAVRRQRPGAESGYVFVDPDGFICEPAYDLGVTVRSFTDEVLAADDPVALLSGWCARLADRTGVDAQSIWEWAFVERVSSGLYLIVCGHHDEGRAHLESAERLIRFDR